MHPELILIAQLPQWSSLNLSTQNQIKTICFSSLNRPHIFDVLHSYKNYAPFHWIVRTLLMLLTFCSFEPLAFILILKIFNFTNLITMTGHNIHFFFAHNLICVETDTIPIIHRRVHYSINAKERNVLIVIN